VLIYRFSLIKFNHATSIFSFTIPGPSTQTDVVVSAEGINTTVIFQAGTSVSNSISIPFGINDDDVGLEDVETYTVRFEILSSTDLVQPGMPMEAVVSIVDSDRKYNQY
jgi:hypothetical protein